MADFLINHLKNKAEEHSALEMLANQWGFDEKLIPKALQTIGNLFPHYSRHDESHSRQILVNIERLLGKKNIAKLTATDTWLLLESAYWHDIGMVVPQKEIEEAFNNPEFSQYTQRIKDNPNHELYELAINLDSWDISKCLASAGTPMEAMDKFRQLMAEWFRQQHATRANIIVQNPWESIGISSPRTKLIPNRLFKLLGRVCQMHGSPFNDLLAPNGLPYREAGLAQEDCHPRFVACLLRMGDLLDLDDNRFCPVMQRISGENRPAMSKAHEDKHAGIYHLRIDRDRIEITAECQTVDGYLETFKWFDWLRQEMQNQVTRWRDIVPSREFGLLPTLGNLEVRLHGEQKILKKGQRPQFSIDGQQAIKLLQGSNLYSSHFVCIRELLQNAVDATLLHLWLSHKKNEAELIWENPHKKQVKEVLQSKAIDVKLEEQASHAGISDDNVLWRLTITDQGTGISLDDLRYMICIGGSRRNTCRQTKIQGMPEWMKPSGCFGIGFQSVFLICEEVKLTTKSIFTNEILEITMHDPMGAKEGLVILKPLENDVYHPYGTTIEIDFELKKIADLPLQSFRGDYKSFENQLLDFYDPILDDSLPLEAMQLGGKIQDYTRYSDIPIRGELLRIDHPSFQIGTKNDPPNSKWKFVNQGDCPIALYYTLTQKYGDFNWDGGYSNITILYRGQAFKQSILALPYINITINLLSNKADHWLTVNRDYLRGTANKEFKQVILNTLATQVSDDLQNLDEVDKPKYSFFLEGMALKYEGQWRELANKVESAWLNLVVPFEREKTYQEFFNCDKWTLEVTRADGKHLLGSYDLIVDRREKVENIIIHEWVKKEGNTVQAIQSEKHYVASAHQTPFYFILKNGYQVLYTASVLATVLVGKYGLTSENLRVLLPFEDGWEGMRLPELYLKNDQNIKASRLFDFPKQDLKIILLPFLYGHNDRENHAGVLKITPEKLEKLCKWVQPRLELDKKPSIDSIKKAYQRLIDFIDRDVMNISDNYEFWKELRGLK